MLTTLQYDEFDCLIFTKLVKICHCKALHNVVYTHISLFEKATLVMKLGLCDKEKNIIITPIFSIDYVISK